MKQLTISIIDLYNFLKKYPEYVGKINVESRFGFYPIDACEITAHSSEVYKITLESGKILKGSPDHLLFNEKNTWIKIKDLTLNNKLFTYDGLEKIKSISKLKRRADLYDIQVRKVHEFYANGIISHNSNILSGLVFALFGKTINDIEKEHIPHRLMTNKEKCEVAINLQVDDEHYRIIRGIKSKNKYCDLFKLDKESNVYVPITKSGMKETQKFIEKEIIHCNISLFLRSILLTSDQSYNFFKLKKEQKCEFIEQVFDLVIFGVMYDFLHKDILKIDKEIYALSREYKTIEDQLVDCTSKKDLYEENQKSKLSNIKKIVEELNEKLNKLQETTLDFSQQLNDYKAEKEKNLEKIDKLSVKQKEIKEKYHQLDKDIDKLKLKIQQNNTLIEKHKATLSILCKECFTKFDDLYKISELKNEIEEFSKKQSELDEQKTKNSESYTKLNDAIKTLQTKNVEISKNRDELVNKKNSRDSEINRATSDISVNNALLNKLETEVNPYIQTFDSLTINLNDINEKLAKNNKECNHYKYIEKLVSPDMIRKLIIKDLIEYLNNRIHLYICRMGAKFTCVFDENLFYRFYTDSGETTYDNFSSGEKMRLSIATSFAFRDFMTMNSCVNSNILILDEYLDSNLDASSIINLMNILKEFSIINHYDIYIVSHRKEIADTFFNNIITVEKTNGISKIGKEMVKGSKQ